VLALGAVPAAASGAKPFKVTGGTVTITFEPANFGSGADTTISATAPGHETVPGTFVFPLHGGTIYGTRNRVSLSYVRGSGGLTFAGSAGSVTFGPVWGGADGIADNEGRQLLMFDVIAVSITAHTASFTTQAQPGASYLALFGSGAALNDVATVTVAAKGHR